MAKSENDRRGNGAEGDGRRDFLKVVGIGGLGTAAVGGVLGPAVRTVTFPVSTETTSGGGEFVDIGKAERFKEGAPPVKVDVIADQVDSWNRVEQVKIGSAWVFRKGDQLLAYSTVCPHLGCGVDYVGEQSKFYCACHKTWFKGDGSVEDGPSQRGLDTLELREEKGKVSLRYQRFKLGIVGKEPV